MNKDGGGPRNTLSFRGTRARADDNSASDEADEAETIWPVHLAPGARSQLSLVLRSFYSTTEVIEANDAMRAVPEALVRSSNAAYGAMRAAPAIFTR